MLQVIDEGIKIHRVWWNVLRSIGLKGDFAKWTSDISLGLVLFLMTYFLYRILYSYLQGQSITDILSMYIKESKISLIQEEILLHLLRLFICVFFVGISHIVLDSKTAKEYALPLIDFVSKIYLLFLLWYIVHYSLHVADDIYKSYKVGRRLPITSYIQTLQIVVFVAFLIIIFCVVFSVNIRAIFAGLGAMTAVILLIFKDSITGFVASLQIALVDIVRVGDWITIPSLKVDGDVIELSLWNTKIRNFDKTIVSIPSSALINTSVINWRGMQKSGGRRIKKSVIIDVNTICLLDKERIGELRKNEVLKSEIKDFLGDLDSKTSNLLLFRKYLENCFNKNLNIHNENFTCMVRILQPTEFGVPLEIYVFTNTVVWKEYEHIQSKIIEDIVCISRFFGLKIYQRPS